MSITEPDTQRKQASAKVVHGEHPAPEVTTRPAEPEEIPAGARTVRNAAVVAGWAVEVTYARGTTVDAHGKPGRLLHSIALRMRRSAQYAAAAWTAPVVTPGEWVGAVLGVAAWAAADARPLPLAAVKMAPKPKWTFDFAGYLGSWRCERSQLRGRTPIKLSSVQLKAYLKDPAPTGEVTEEALRALALLVTNP